MSNTVLQYAPNNPDWREAAREESVLLESSKRCSSKGPDRSLDPESCALKSVLNLSQRIDVSKLWVRNLREGSSAILPSSRDIAIVGWRYWYLGRRNSKLENLCQNMSKLFFHSVNHKINDATLSWGDPAIFRGDGTSPVTHPNPWFVPAK